MQGKERCFLQRNAEWDVHSIVCTVCSGALHSVHCALDDRQCISEWIVRNALQIGGAIVHWGVDCALGIVHWDVDCGLGCRVWGPSSLVHLPFHPSPPLCILAIIIFMVMIIIIISPSNDPSTS